MQCFNRKNSLWNLAALVDVSGVGSGLASFLADQLGRGPRRVIVSPFLFNRKTKSDLGWAFIGLIDGVRIKEYADDGADSTGIYRHQLAACTYEVLPGPGKLLRWSVPSSRGTMTCSSAQPSPRGSMGSIGGIGRRGEVGHGNEGVSANLVESPHG